MRRFLEALSIQSCAVVFLAYYPNMKAFIYSIGVVLAMDRPKLWLDDKLHIRLKSLDTLQNRPLRTEEPKIEEAKALYTDGDSTSVLAARIGTTILASTNSTVNSTSTTSDAATAATTQTLGYSTEESTRADSASADTKVGEIKFRTTSAATNGTGTGYQWFVSEFSECNVFCGNGTQQRVVVCKDSTGEVSLDSICEASYPKPDSVIDCEGPCISCPDLNSDFFTRSGLGTPASPAMWGSNLTQLSFCPVGNISCCTAENEQMIKSQAALASKALDSVLLNSPTVKTKAATALENYNTVVQQKLTETSNALTAIQALIDAGASDKLNVMPILKEALTQRQTDLTASIDIMQKAMTYVDEQITSYSSQLTGSDKFSQCTQAALTLNAEIACSSCSPTFTTSFVNKSTSTVMVSLDDCQAVYEACEPVIATGHSELLSALSEMEKVHESLTLVAAKLQVALSRVWSTLQFDWVPGDTLPSDINSNPDMTKLMCIKDSVAFSLPKISEPSDFCGMYFSPFAANTFASRLELTLMQGIKSLTDLSNCDGCIHGVLVRLSTVISQGSAALDVSLPLGSEVARGRVNACMMASQPPQARLLLNQMTKSRSFVKMPHDFREEESGTYPLRIGFVSSGGVEASVAGNFSNYSELINIDTVLPPQEQWKIRSTSPPALQIWDVACTDHTTCYDQLDNKNADAPWWFCASTTACESGNCGVNDEVLLKSGSRCAMGQCVNGTQAIDGVCPDYAVCPTTTYEPFAGPSYFYKFQSLVTSTPGSSGVCDCAFSSSVSSTGVAKKETISVTDLCVQATCAAYALQFETSSSCNQQLSALCLKAQKSGCDVDCDSEQAQYSPPSCDANQFGQMKSEVRSSAGRGSLGVVAALVTFAILVSW